VNYIFKKRESKGIGGMLPDNAASEYNFCMAFLPVFPKSTEKSFTNKLICFLITSSAKFCACLQINCFEESL